MDEHPDVEVVEPSIESIRQLKQQLSEASWRARLLEAQRRARVLEAVLAACGDGPVTRRAVREHGEGMRWSTFCHRLRAYRGRDGQPWERLIDRRLLTKPWTTPASWRAAVRLLARHAPDASCDHIRQALQDEFGPSAGISDTSIRRILKEAGINHKSKRLDAQETVVELTGGGGLVLLLAAARQTAAVEQIAEAVLTLAGAQEPPEGDVPAEPEGRDAQGRLTGSYNTARKAMAEQNDQDPVYRSVEQARDTRDLTRLQLTRMQPETLVRRLMSVVALPLISDRRGMAGLEGPMSTWLQALTGEVPMAATVDKTLSELKWLGAADVMWAAHASTWTPLSQRWSESAEGWQVLLSYIDTSKDPWWTERFGRSGKVSLTGRTQPCLSRVLISSGPGVPIYMEVRSGTASLSPNLGQYLERVDKLLGAGHLGRITVVDAECGNLNILKEFSAHKERDIVTLLKGNIRKGKELVSASEWQDYRKHDALREGVVNLEPKLKEGFTVRVIEMKRREGEGADPTWFVTTASAEVLGTQAVADAYLRRWPYQEDLFRRGRNGIGMERSHGYGARSVENIGVIAEREKTAEALKKAEQALEEASRLALAADFELEAATARLEDRQESGKPQDGRSTTGVRRARETLTVRRQAEQVARKARQDAEARHRKAVATPTEIYVRDTALDSVTSCLKMSLMTLLEYVSREYFDGYHMMPRTFAEALVPLPVTIRTQRHHLIYEVAPNYRDPKMTTQLEQALQRVTAANIKIGDRLLIARLRQPAEWTNTG